ncbi:single-stranded-DNA-specific exonuclease RecJ [Bacteroides gallinaceum]|uniref:Single-stranded-DNA-specific exonuclease RecJ n=2 Tax=Bacteroidaceae TaxID=815 RepID=A0ABT7VC63_9BACE|nr:single-stranded-DNA-specific exonuclease RecJ [Bacteroides gallinaceum]MBU3856333.1 single-stranded-DNA-specific exonuclease RecJ [Candidatus Phocaeicola excrementipullorum]MBW9199906.1 single-stranded-DNA-specific exonuclease RecJ [Bacteroidales bacterium SW299]MDM8323885.1 single-stranded-DNA-specific exonuclease RecJ [Bacteroides gallinaceum]
MKYKWNYQPPTPIQREAAKALSRELGISPILCRLLQERGIKTAAEAKHFFRPQLSELHDPFLMNDMEKAVERLNRAMGRKERVMIYGDYDVDGTTAVSLVYKFLQQFYSNIDYYIPDRYEEGYGVSEKGIDYAYETGVKLIIVLDCGIKAVGEIAYAKEKGIDFIICDHHVPDDVLPPAAAILNPKRFDSTYPYEHLSGCGVGFKFMQAFAMNNGIDFHQLVPLLDLVAVSIASDIVPIMGENRVLAYHGLRQLNSNPSIGLKAIIDVCGLADREITMSDIVFKIGPRINASGRIQNGKEAVDLLIEKDFASALRQSNQINRYNEARKDLDKSMTEEANRIVDGLADLSERRSIVIFNEAWHKGVIGIVASRLTEIYYRPAVVLTRTGDMATGSARSVSGFDVYKAIEYCRDLLENFGGHTYAAGLSMKVENVPEFSRRFEEYVTGHILPEQTNATIDIDAQIDFRDITPKFFFDLKKFNPFGPDNHKPVFATFNVYDYGTSKVVGRGQEHIKLELVDNKSNNVMNGIAFGQSSQVRYIKSKQSFNICYTIEENTHKRGEVQLQIEDIKPNKMF